MGSTRSSRILEPRRRQRSWSISQAASISSWIWTGRAARDPESHRADPPAQSSPGYVHQPSPTSHLSRQEHQDVPGGLSHMDLQHRHHTGLQVVCLWSLVRRTQGHRRATCSSKPLPLLQLDIHFIPDPLRTLIPSFPPRPISSKALLPSHLSPPSLRGHLGVEDVNWKPASRDSEDGGVIEEGGKAGRVQCG